MWVKMKNRLSWDEYFALVTKTVSLRSDDSETKIGAVIIDEENRIVSTGYNGTPKGTIGLPTTRNKNKYPFMVHAEENAILFSRRNLKNCKIYVLGMLPCDSCARSICQVGINEVIVVNPIKRENGKDWNNDSVIKMFKQLNIKIREIIVPLQIRLINFGKDKNDSDR